MNATITDRQIRTLRHEAEEAGDLAQAALCVLALGGRRALDGAEDGTEWALLAERVDAGAMTQDTARAECEAAILAGQG